MKKKSIPRTRLLYETGLILLGGCITYWLSSRFDLLESYLEIAQEHENLELDELLVLSIYLMMAFFLLSLTRLKEIRKKEQQLTEKNKMLQKSLDENFILLRESHHRIKNNIASIKSFLNLSRASLNGQEEIHIFDEAIGKVQSMYTVYDKLLRSDQYKMIALDQYLKELVPLIITLFTEVKDVHLTLNIDDMEIEIDEAILLGIIINELITNSLKYGYSGNDFSIYVSVNRYKNRMRLTVQDNGRGFSPTDEPDSGLGMKILDSLVRQLDGELSMENEHGVKTVISYPYGRKSSSSPTPSPLQPEQDGSDKPL